MHVYPNNATNLRRFPSHNQQRPCVISNIKNEKHVNMYICYAGTNPLQLAK